MSVINKPKCDVLIPYLCSRGKKIREQNQGSTIKGDVRRGVGGVEGTAGDD
jgi:hypothetical protein